MDWRADYRALSYAAIQPPAALEDALLAFMHQMGLAYAAVDFVVTPEGRWVFLEANPGGQYGWLEAHTGLPISAALADLLSAGGNS